MAISMYVSWVNGLGRVNGWNMYGFGYIFALNSRILRLFRSISTLCL